MPTIITKGQLDCTSYAEAARDAGCPIDQIIAFVKARIVLQPRQLQASALARQCDSPDGPTAVGFGGARGGGKSHWMVAQLSEDCLRYDGLKCLLLRKVGRSNQENFNDLRRRLLKRINGRYTRNTRTLKFNNGSTIILGHYQNESDIDGYLGLEYDVIGIEEATTLSHSKYIMIRTCLRTSKPGWRPRMYSTTNPGGIGHAWYIDEFVAPYLAGEITTNRFVPATVDDNRFLNADYIKILDNLPGWKRRAWRNGEWDIAAGQFFTNFRRHIHVLKGKDISGIQRWWCAMDYGFVHYTVVYLFGTDGDGNIFVVDEHAERNWQVEQHAQAIKAMLARHSLVLQKLRWFVGGGDLFSVESTGATIAQQYLKQGIRLTRANLDRVQGAGKPLDLLGNVDAKSDDGRAEPVRPKLFILERCHRLICCIPSLVRSTHNPEDVHKVDVDEMGQGGDDPYDACRYGIMAEFERSKTPVFDPTTMILGVNLHRPHPPTPLW